jgi:hypothetical protein
MHIKYCLKTLNGRHHLADPGIDGKTIIKTYLREIGSEGVDCTDLAQDKKNRWRALVNTIMNRGTEKNSRRHVLH